MLRKMKTAAASLAVAALVGCGSSVNHPTGTKPLTPSGGAEITSEDPDVILTAIARAAAAHYDDFGELCRGPNSSTGFAGDFFASPYKPDWGDNDLSRPGMLPGYYTSDGWDCLPFSLTLDTLTWEYGYGIPPGCSSGAVPQCFGVGAVLPVDESTGLAAGSKSIYGTLDAETDTFILSAVETK